VAFFIGSACGGRGTRGAVAISLVAAAAAAAILPIGPLALGSAAVARGLAALRGAGGRFRSVSSAAWGCVSRHGAGSENQATKGSQK